MKPGNYISEKLYHQNKVHSMIRTLFIPQYFFFVQSALCIHVLWHNERKIPISLQSGQKWVDLSCNNSHNCIKLFLIGLIIILFFKTTIYQLEFQTKKAKQWKLQYNIDTRFNIAYDCLCWYSIGTDGCWYCIRIWQWSYSRLVHKSLHCRTIALALITLFRKFSILVRLPAYERRIS